MIPSFSISGTLPPFVGDNPAVRAEMSPYQTSMVAIVRRFATSVERIDILKGLLDYRQALRDFGFENGFQWINGSFVEQVEDTRGRPPADIDIVTFAKRPDMSEEHFAERCKEHQDLLSPRCARQQYKCDAYIIDLRKDPQSLVDDTRYWFGLFSHQRTTALWKGMLVIPLDSDDNEARRLLEGEG